jgi:hypothetical protein
VISQFDSAGWAFLCAGGSLPRLPGTTDPHLLESIPRLQPWPEACSSGRWVLRGPGEYLVYLGRNADPTLDLSLESGTFVAKEVEPKTGKIVDARKSVAVGKSSRLPKSPNSTAVIWLSKE